MGTVFEAEHLRLHRRVAVKLMSPEPTARPELIVRFRQEAEIVSVLDNPHIVTVLDFDVTENGELYLVLELLHGETLEKRIDREKHLSLEDAVQITNQLASALSTLHGASVVHRDLKPSNVFLTDAPGEPVFVKLLDFGISKNLRTERRITQERTLVGTPEYMSPEQAMGRNDLVDHRTDQFALAVVAYEMLTGRQPFDHEDLGEVLQRVTKLDATPPSSLAAGIPVELDAVLARALSKSPAARFEDVTEFARAFAAAALATNGSPSLMPTRAPVWTTRLSDARPGSDEQTANVARCLERVRAALDAGAVREASMHAEAALRIAESGEDPVVAALVGISEALLTSVFMRWIGSPARCLFTNDRPPPASFPVSPRAAFLLSRIDDGISVRDLLDVAWMPRLQALRWLIQLVSCGSVRLGNANGSSPGGPRHHARRI